MSNEVQELLAKIGEKIESRYPIRTFMINSDNIAEYNNGGWQ